MPSNDLDIKSTPRPQFQIISNASSQSRERTGAETLVTEITKNAFCKFETSLSPLSTSSKLNRYANIQAIVLNRPHELFTYCESKKDKIFKDAAIISLLLDYLDAGIISEEIFIAIFFIRIDDKPLVFKFFNVLIGDSARLERLENKFPGIIGTIFCIPDDSATEFATMANAWVSFLDTLSLTNPELCKKLIYLKDPSGKYISFKGNLLADLSPLLDRLALDKLDKLD